MLKLRGALGHYRELILAATFVVMATWEVLEILLLEPAYRASRDQSSTAVSRCCLALTTSWATPS